MTREELEDDGRMARFNSSVVYNAVGVRVDELPITPEKILRGIRAMGGAKPQARLGAAI